MSTIDVLRRIVIATGLLGTLLFGSLLALSYAQPTFVESIARKVVRLEVERRVGSAVERLDSMGITTLATRLRDKNAREMADIQRSLPGDLADRIAAISEKLRQPECECRIVPWLILQSNFPALANVERLFGLRSIQLQLDNLIRTKYLDVAAALSREFRIFTAANALAFAALALLGWVRRRAPLQLALVACLLLVAASSVAFLYLFRQDWLHTIVFGDYVGLAYFAYLGAAVAGLADIAFNRARVTTALLDAACQAVGAAMPC